MKKIIKYSLVLVALVSVVAGCSKGESKEVEDKSKIVKLGIIGDDTDVWDDVKNRLKKDGIALEYVKFSDYNQPNSALADGSIDLNAFQHQFFLDNYNKEHGTDLVSIGNTVNAPMAIFSENLKEVTEIKEGGEIAIPNDVTNGGRALLLLQSAGLIKIDEKTGNTPTVTDITENTKKLKITELDASQTARALQDVDLSVINSGVAVDAGFSPQEDSIFVEPVDENSKPYVNIIVSRREDENNKVYQKIVDAYQTDETKKVIDETSKNTSFPAWDTFGRK